MRKIMEKKKIPIITRSLTTFAAVLLIFLEADILPLSHTHSGVETKIPTARNGISDQSLKELTVTGDEA